MNRVVDFVVEQLVNYNIDTYFIVTGGAIAPFIDAVGLSKKTKYYCFQHEQAAAMAAEGFWKSSGKIGVVLVTSGPGAQNILNGVCGSWYESVPCIFITGQVNSKDSLDFIKSKPRQVGFQETPTVSIFSTCTLFSEKITNSKIVSDIFSKALTIMTYKRNGPVHIDFPVDIQLEKNTNLINFNYNNPFDSYDKIPSIEKILNNSKRPLLVIGAGCKNSNINEWITIPFICSWGGFDIVKEHPLFIGNHGIYGDRIANFALQNADLLIILGSRMDTRQTGSNVKACSVKSIKIMVDIDSEEISKMSERGFIIDIPIITTVQKFISEVKPTINCDKWLETINIWKENFGIEKREGYIYEFIKNINFPEECIIIPDTGATLTWTLQSLKLKKKQRLFTNLGNSSMGYALPAAIGAFIANPEMPIICISGDGGIQMNIQELETIRHLKASITIIVINNNGHGIVRQFQDTYLSSRHTGTSSIDLYGTDEGINIANISKGFGIDSKRISTDEEVIISLNEPFLYDVMIDPKEKIYPKMEFGSTLENMAPYRPELLKFMLI
jgi:acetolactate synthase-1/2/3 large subunit